MSHPRTKYLQIIAYVMIIAILIFIIGIARNCGRLPVSPKEGYSGGDTLDIALLYGPGGFYTYNDTLAGINIDIVSEFAKSANITVKTWAISNAAEGMTKLEAGAFDILASLPLDNYIKNRFPITESVFLDRLVLVQLKDSVTGETPVKSSLDLNGKSVHVASASSALQRITNLADEIGGKIEIIEEPELSEELLTLKVANGSIPFAVVNEKVAKKIVETYPLLNYDNSVSFTQFQVWLFNSKDSIISKKFNDWFEDFRTTDEYRNILNKY